MLTFRHKYASPAEKIKMIQMRESGAPCSEIARELQRDSKTVKLWLDRWDAEQSIDVRPKSGAGRSLTTEEEANLIIDAQQNQYKTAPMLKEHFGFECTDRSIQNYLNRSDINSFKSPIKPAIVAVNREGRVSFAEVFKHWSVEDWKRVVFTDESSFYNQRSCSRRIWRRRGIEAAEEPVPTSYRRFRINVWAAISYEKVEFVTRVSNNFNSQKYLQLLQEVVPMTQNNIANLIWMHDNVSFHRTECIEQYFEQNGVQKMRWPPQSPDLNPIENLWALISQKLNLMIDTYGNAKTPTELFERVVDCAGEISPETFNNLYTSLPNRWKLVLEKNGGPTRY